MLPDLLGYVTFSCSDAKLEKLLNEKKLNKKDKFNATD